MSDTIYYDPGSNLPNPTDPTLILRYISDVNTYTCSKIGKALFDESKKSKEKQNQYENHMKKKFPKFYRDFPSTFNIVISKDEQGYKILMDMLMSISNIKNGSSSFDTEEKKVISGLADRFGVTSIVNNINKSK